MMQPEDYMPKYDADIVQWHTTNPDVTQSINPAYCLNADSADELQDILGNAGAVGTLYDAPPYPTRGGSPYDYNRLVPWLRFLNGEERNCGQLASYWANPEGNPMPGVPKSEALNAALKDIATPVGE
jgi:hypothetical protein